MNRIIILLLFTFQFTLGQSKIQHEPERLFNQLELGMSRKEYIKKNNIKKISFLRNSALSSSLEFDENGNTIIQIGMENDYVRKSIHKFDNKNREIESKHFNPDGTFRYGYYYKFQDGLRLMYKLEDSLLYRKSTYFEPENIRIYSEYNKDGTLKLKNIYVFDSKNRYLLETRFNKDAIRIQYRYEYIGNKKYVTKIQYDENGTKISERRHLDEEKLPNELKLKYYREDNESLFRIDFFDKKDNLIKIELYDNDNQLYHTETKEYDSQGKVKKVIKENFQRPEKIEYIYIYDKQNRIKTIKKITNRNTEKFEYQYEVNK